MIRQLRRLAPALAGARIADRFFAGLGAMGGVGLAGFLSEQAAGGTQPSPWLVAPIGASSVLLFAVPSSPLAQPWSIIGGNVVSGLIGLAVGARIGDPLIGCGVAVGLAIMAMALLRCLHPPGGAVALMTALLAHGAATPLSFALAPVGLNSVFLVALGWVFHRFSGHSYPHVPPAPAENVHETRDPTPILRAGFRAADLDDVLAELHESFDIDRGDLETLLRQIELRVLMRAQGQLTCADIMSKDVIGVRLDATTGVARDMMRERKLRCMPVVNRLGILAGMVSAGDLIGEDVLVAAVVTPALVAQPSQPALRFVGQLTDGTAHEVVVVDGDYRVIGLITQTDLLAALAWKAATA